MTVNPDFRDLFAALNDAQARSLEVEQAAQADRLSQKPTDEWDALPSAPPDKLDLAYSGRLASSRSTPL